MAKQTNKQKQKKIWSFGFFLVSDASYNTYMAVFFFYSCIYYFAPFSIEILACLTDSYSPRAKNALNSCMSSNFAILKKYGRKIAPDLTGITREVHKS